MALGADRAIHLVTDEEWDAQATAAAIVDAIRAEEPFDLIVFGNESADAGNFQVGIRVAYALGLPVVTGLKGLTVADGRARCEQEVAAGRDVYDVALPAVVTVKEGLNLPRYPSVPAKLRANRKPVDARPVDRPASRLEKLRLVVPEGVRQAGRGPRSRAGGCDGDRRGDAEAGRRMSVVVFVEPDDDLSLQAVHARRESARWRCARSTCSVRRRRMRRAAWAAAIDPARRAAGRLRSSAPGSDRGNEVLAHVAAQLDLPIAANVTEARGDEVTRQRWGGTLLEEARVHGETKLLTAAPFAFAAASGEAGPVEHFTPALAEADAAVRVVDTHQRARVGGLARRREGRRLGRARRRLERGLRDPRGAGGATRRSRRLLARGHERRLASAHRPGRPDGHEGLAGPLHRVRDQRRDAAHRGLQGREDAPRDQRRSRGDDLLARRLRRGREPARDRPGDLRRAAGRSEGHSDARRRGRARGAARGRGHALRAARALPHAPRPRGEAGRPHRRRRRAASATRR